MRPPVDEARIHALAEALGRMARRPTRIYLTGGASAVLEGWRNSTVDVDLRLEPDADELLSALPALKERLRLNIELASPPDFIPALPGWENRSPIAFSVGNAEIRHFDFYSQALSKIERGFTHDLDDVRMMFRQGLVDPDALRALYRLVEPELYRYPAIDPAAFAKKVEDALVADEDQR
jgi:hypothetical protein